jgi:hypothetical protein
MLILLLQTALAAPGDDGATRGSRIHGGDHLVQGQGAFTIVDGEGLLTLSASYEYVLKQTPVGLGGQIQLVAGSGASLLGLGPRATYWFTGGDALTPYAGGSLTLYTGDYQEAIGLGGHGGIALWMSETSAIDLGGRLDLLIADGEVYPQIVVAAGVLGVGRKRG